jgi:hypothetical protein
MEDLKLTNASAQSERLRYEVQLKSIQTECISLVSYITLMGLF